MSSPSNTNTTNSGTESGNNFLLSSLLNATTSKWTKLGGAALASTAVLGYELSLQHKLTCPPDVYAQLDENGPMKPVYDSMISTAKEKGQKSTLERPIRPALFLGTRGLAASVGAYFTRAPASTGTTIQFRELIHMPADGGVIAIEWELPNDPSSSLPVEEQKQQVLKGPIRTPIVVVIHGINNHANFGYIRTTMRACCEQGWIAIGMHLRGCGGVTLRTPRSYNAAFTGDIRGLVQTIEGRLASTDGSVPIVLVGNSLGAALVTKYLGEEGMSNSLPSCVVGGAALGNPSVVSPHNVDWMFSSIMALGAKKTLLEHYWTSFRHANDATTKECIKKALMAITIGEFDDALAPIMIRNEPFYPFSSRLGFKGESLQGCRHLPLLTLTVRA